MASKVYILLRLKIMVFFEVVKWGFSMRLLVRDLLRDVVVDRKIFKP